MTMTTASLPPLPRARPPPLAAALSLPAGTPFVAVAAL